ncbi:DUF6011 domain-containing protein [Halalkalibacterium halodurans]|uniref:Uncharacterized protein n=1 Tax=Halalkalibacterium halodurans TaxID=86665 RepID=A0A0M0KM63_ALKHA|nr:DUF6011 domain-containing protein [Halalkalibacterium halodurans]TPE70646.1 hypothetical protein AMD02_001365 [Halalkalibacterium halodurans]
MESNDLYTTCLRCGRQLKTARSRQLGMGPTCAKKMKDEREKQQQMKLFEVQGENFLDELKNRKSASA